VVTLIVYQSWVQWVFANIEYLDSRVIAVWMWLVRLCLCASFLVLMLKFGLRFCNYESRVHKHLAANSYRMYLLHPAIVVLVQLPFLYWEQLDRYTVFFGTIVLSLAATYVVSVLLGAVWQWVLEVARSPTPATDAEAEPEPSLETTG
jgi:hypothetical protein